MNRLPVLFLGIFGAFAAAWLGMVYSPNAQIGHLMPQVDADSKEATPPMPDGRALAGEKVYAANGCVSCHTQQVRDSDQGADIARGWGTRPTVARDYIFQNRVFLGTMRTGPDLANVGARQTNAMWYHQHLYEPQTLTPGSSMAPYKYLYVTRRIAGQPSAEALVLEGEDKPESGYEVVPTQAARDLVAYLLSLNKSYTLPEAP